MMRQRSLALGRRLVLGLGLLMALAVSQPPARAAPPPVTIGGPFTLTAADGTAVTDQTYRGKWLLVYFGYTSCSDTCPTVLNEIATALQQLGPAAAKVQPLFITVDPEHDTPEVLAHFVKNFDPRIVGLTGNPQQIVIVAKEYGAYYNLHIAGDDEGRVIVHSSYIYLVNPLGKFVRGFDVETADEHFADTLRKLVAQTP